MIKQLTEEHRRLAEMVLTGKPRTMNQRAEALGVDRATIYRWMADTMWRVYFEKLCDDMEAARAQRLLPLVLAGADALECALGNAVQALNSPDLKERAEAPNLKTLTDSLRTLVELERVDRGKPGRITESRSKDEGAPGLPTTSRGKLLLQKLDELVATADAPEIPTGETDPSLN